MIPLGRGAPVIGHHDHFFPGKGVTPPLPEAMDFFIIPQSMGLCLMGYMWFGKASTRSPSKF
jgi:hypothetical protein